MKKLILLAVISILLLACKDNEPTKPKGDFMFIEYENDKSPIARYGTAWTSVESFVGSDQENYYYDLDIVVYIFPADALKNEPTATNTGLLLLKKRNTNNKNYTLYKSEYIFNDSHFQLKNSTEKNYAYSNDSTVLTSIERELAENPAFGQKPQYRLIEGTFTVNNITFKQRNLLNPN